MCLLDIGGGFPGSEDVKLKFEEVIIIKLIFIAIFTSSILEYFETSLSVLTNIKRNCTNKNNVLVLVFSVSSVLFKIVFNMLWFCKLK